eukprot:CAMPEP_0196652708 /NCGR_PEP_ID=MMETSP1086-20130531/2084_1 /TAXON_ID=77921 /ORGANISM="Cyanoptyche  gloeocystis , Strain SAG4.97" /LENGTH=38 /DNA_ID= /DNA_START= /DNA_END= /DNA_ORIENTATION=
MLAEDYGGRGRRWWEMFGEAGQGGGAGAEATGEEVQGW